jgi:hypothetical protein
MKSSKMVAVTNGLSDIIDVPRNCFVAAVRVPSDYQGQINIMGSFGGDVVLVVAEGEIVDVNAPTAGSVVVLYPEAMKPLAKVRFVFDTEITAEIEICLLLL